MSVRGESYAEPPHVPYGNIHLWFISPLRFLLRVSPLYYLHQIAATFHVMWCHLFNWAHMALSQSQKNNWHYNNLLVSPGRYFLWKLVTVVLIQTAWQDSFTWPLVIFLLSCCIYPLASSCAHTFNSMSARARHICFFFDYGALSFYSLGKCMWFSPFIESHSEQR